MDPELDIGVESWEEGSDVDDSPDYDGAGHSPISSGESIEEYVAKVTADSLPDCVSPERPVDSVFDSEEQRQRWAEAMKSMNDIDDPHLAALGREGLMGFLVKQRNAKRSANRPVFPDAQDFESEDDYEAAVKLYDEEVGRYERFTANKDLYDRLASVPDPAELEAERLKVEREYELKRLREWEESWGAKPRPLPEPTRADQVAEAKKRIDALREGFIKDIRDHYAEMIDAWRALLELDPSLKGRNLFSWLEENDVS